MNVPTDPEREDRRRGATETFEPDVEAAVEEDHDQREDGDALNFLDREQRVGVGDELANQDGADEEDGRIRNGEPVREPHADERHEHGAGDPEDGRPEVADLAHVEESTTWRAEP